MTKPPPNSEPKPASPSFKWDVGDFEACAAGIADVTGALGPIDMLVNNAGITRDAMLHKMTARAMARGRCASNLDSLFNMCRHVIDGMRERNYGRIINISSINGQKGQMGQTNYSAAKAGIIGFTKALAQETAKKGITVNVICPGYIDTEMVRRCRRRCWKASSRRSPSAVSARPRRSPRCRVPGGRDAAFITGATLTVNGAQYIAG